MRTASLLVLVMVVACVLPAIAGDLGSDAGTPGAPGGVSIQTTSVAAAAVTAYTSTTSTTRVPVQQVARRRALCSDDYAGVECYIRHWCLTGKRADEIRREYLELLAMDIYHLPVYFRRTPEALYADYQVYIQSLNRVDRYVNVPSTNLPAFQAYPPVGGQLCAPALATDFGCEQTVSVAPQTVGGAHQFGRDREVFEAPVASVDFSKFKTEREHEHHHYPPGEEDCGNFPGGPGNIPGPGVPYGN